MCPAFGDRAGGSESQPGMSDIPADYRDRLDLRTILAEIDRKQAETRKRQQESDTFVAEQRKLIAEGDKLNRDRWLAPWVLVTSLSSGLVVAIVSHFWK
jgi:hypothetical protein